MKRLSRISFVTIILVTILSISGLALSAAVNKPRVAVLPFDDGSIEHWWGSNWQVGVGISDMIVTDLLDKNCFRMIEREQIEKVLGEQDFGASGRVDPRTAAKIGKILGVQYIIIGKVTEFSIQSQRTNLVVISARSNKAKVAIDGRMVDTTTAEIVAGAKGAAEKSKTTAFNLSYYYSVGFNSADFHKDILGQCTREAIDNFTTELVKRVGASETLTPPAPECLTGTVAYASGDRIIINIGSNHGVQPGMIFNILKVLEEVKDPDTDEIIDLVTEVLAEVEATEVKDKSTTCRVIKRLSKKAISVKDRAEAKN